MSSVLESGSPLAQESSEQEMHEKVLAYLPFVRRVAQRIARRLPGNVGLDELMSAGVVGLLEAFQRYDVSKNAKFESYAEFRVKGAILDDLRRRDLMARDARLESKTIERATEFLTQQLSRTPEEDEIATALGLDVDELRVKLQRLTPVRVIAWDDMPAGYQAGSLRRPDVMAMRRCLVAALTESIQDLSERQQQILQLYYIEELTLKQIGGMFSVSESRVSQIISEIILRLRTQLKASWRRGGVPGEGSYE